MKTLKEQFAKKQYTQPHVERIIIDIEISLQYTSTAPQPDPGEEPLGSNDFFKRDHFDTNKA